MTKRTTLIAPSREGRTAEAGFTLVEALIAVVILIFGLVGITNLFLVAASSNTTANQSTGATSIASQRLEQLKAIPFTTLVTGGDLESGTDPAFYSLDDVPGVGQIVTRWTVTAVSGNNQVYYIEVRSEATGVFGPGRSRAQFTTFRSCTSTDIGCPAP